jgi:hypothetical protein
MNLENILQRADVWRGASASPAAGIATGFADLDAQLGGGWPEGALVEILHAHAGIGEFRLLLPALARLSREPRWIALVAPPYIPYAPALVRAGVDLSRVLVIWSRDCANAASDALWAAEQALRAGTCSTMLAWPRVSRPGSAHRLDFRVLRRLQLAAEQGNTLGVLFRPIVHESESSPAALRLKLSPAEGGVTVQVLKRRGGWAAGPAVIELDRVLRPGAGQILRQGSGHAVAVPSSAGARARNLRARR